MFETEEMSTGFHDIFNNKFSDSSGMCFDLFTSDSMQDMLDIDIKQEVASVVGGANDFAALMEGMPNFSLDADIWYSSKFHDNDDSPSVSHDAETVVAKLPIDIYSEVGACVNPNSVMPVLAPSSNITVFRQAPQFNSKQNGPSLLSSPKVNLNTNINSQNCPSPKEKKSHLTFSPNTIKVPVMIQEQQQPKRQTLLQQSHHNLHQQKEKTVDSVKKDLNGDLVNMKDDQRVPSSSPLGICNSGSSTIKLAAGIGGLTFANSMAFNKLKSSQHSVPISQTKLYSIKRSASPSSNHNSMNNQNVSPLQNTQLNGQKVFTRVVNGKQHNSIITSLSTSGGNHKQRPKGVIVHEYPKPAYSYSCLIAMALKNSRTGSLPVSEIYSFMCEHFPYFKTAPNGWKNSVRHNLSLNKCFGKIEKPVSSGGQRKGCLWAMNPNRIAKMDEEVQKWSRKDPMAIRKAMVFPENLEALERGEMKHGSIDSDYCLEVENAASDIEENSDSELDLDESTRRNGQNMYTIIDTSTLGSCETEEDEDEEDDFTDEADQATLNDIELEISEPIEEITFEEETKHQLHYELHQKGIFQLQPVVTSSPRGTNGSPLAKRPRVDVNYQITPVQFTNIANMQSPHQMHFQQHHQSSTPTSLQHGGNNNRRKVALVNRIA